VISSSENRRGESTVGITLAIISLIVMPTLVWFKRRTGQEMGSAVLVADSADTYLCAWLSAILLIGLVLNATQWAGGGQTP
jgi:divalent metal cation (Fe/Co/Zn/Cd) transporter